MFELFIVAYVILGLATAWYFRPFGPWGIRQAARKQVKAERRQARKES